MDTETKVYLNWYDFQKQTEYICKGEVVDNELWAGTKQANMINVQFLIPGMSAPICHHFHAEKLSLTPDNVPHDDCYLVSGKNNTAYEPLSGGNLRKPSTKVNTSDAWQTVQKFKQEHWNQERNHLRIDALEEFYQLWREAIAAKRGYQPTVAVLSDSVTEISSVPVSQNETPTITLPSHTKPAAPAPKLTRKQKLSTGSITYTDSIQTSFFD